MQRIIITVSLFLFSFIQQITAQENHSITIEFTGMKSDKGDLYVALYNSKDDFLKKSIKGDIVQVKDKKATVVFKNIPEGEYAVSAFHDANDNKKMDTKIFGIPKEPIGISNDAKGFFGPPKYKDAKFTVNADVSLSITIK
ncbi:DUF2141 domain-containing protein [Tenacibaculum sp. 190524A05c]|uniref:DUF2141 domain-containing protein n=1 Tax=Tenacibaculum platacis TaxID=3137852 RepID=A0ABM9NQ65_9FLAO